MKCTLWQEEEQISMYVEKKSCGKDNNRRKGAAMSKGFSRFAVIGILVSLVSVWGVKAQPATEPATTMDLLVVDRDSAAPLEKAKIEVHLSSSDKKMETGADGHATLPLPEKAAGYFYVEIQHDGYVNKLIEWREGDKDPIPAAYTLKMEHGTPIGGKVVDDAGVPIAGAGVVITMRNPTPADGNYAHERLDISYEDAKTGDDGTWTYAGAPAEFDAVELAAWDYHHASGEFYQFKKFSAAQARDGSISLMIPRGVPIEGVVTGADDKPVAGASVNYGGDMASNKMPLQKTDSEGKFEYAAKPGERVVLTVKAKDYAPELVSFTMEQEKKEVSIPLSASKPMFGRIVGPDEEPIPNAWVYPDTWRGFRSLETRIRADKDGKFNWKDAPLDEVQCDVDATSEGYVRETVKLTASDDEIVVRLRKALHVTGTVVDEETGQPIDVFRVVPGIEWGSGRPVTWERQRSQNKSRGGKIDYFETWARPGYAVRIEADGYMPEEQRGIKIEDGEVSFDFKLKKAPNITATVSKPDGTPAAKAKGYLVLPGQNLTINSGTEVNNWSSAEAVADADGKIQFPPQNEAYKIVIVCEDGFAQLDQAKLDESNVITLQGWGKIEGTLTMDDKPAADEKINVQPQSPQINLNNNEPRIDHQYYTNTDADGKFAFDHVVPGDYAVSRREDVPVNQAGIPGNAFTIRNTLTQQVTVNAGETAKVSLGKPADGQ
jgi:hypothetical protein